MSAMIGPAVLLAAHKHCSNHRNEIVASAGCGCFYCETIVGPSEIRDWVDDGQTALCPHCGIDAVIGDQSGHTVTDPAFLKAMHQQWFEG
jgi:hypothetical protein